jgi:uncharacterized membrane protein (DUF106 family)
MRLILLPFKIIWALISMVFDLTGRLIGAVLGLVLLITGLILTVTVVGAIIGIPLLILGLLLMIRSLFG